MDIKPGLKAISLIARLDCALFPFEQAILHLDALEAEEPDLSPELEACRESIRDAVSAIGRAASFVSVRYHVSEEEAA